MFPVKPSKAPATPNGLLDATLDAEQITKWFANSDFLVAVNMGMSGLNGLDIDLHGDIDGWASLMDSWLEVPETFSYSTQSGGEHHVYASDLATLGPATNYRKMQGVDRRAGGSYLIWWGDVVPESREAFTPAPEWLNDPTRERKSYEYAGDTQEWLDSLVEGEPNLLVRNAMDRLDTDLSHEALITAQHSAIRLGAEGNPGVPQLLDKIEELWLSRPAENHSTPESEWPSKYQDALNRGVALFGDTIELLKGLSAPNYDDLPDSINLSLLVGESTANKAVWTKALKALVKGVEDDQMVVSVLWFAPKTMALSREWGVQFVAQRVQEERARQKPNEFHEPIIKPTQNARRPLLEDYEQEVVDNLATFPKLFLRVGKEGGFINEAIAKPAAWNCMSVAFAFRGFIPVTPTDKLGLNLWFINLAGSGTGKSRAVQMERTVLNAIYDGDNEDAGYSVAAETSPAGLHELLLRRDHQPTLFAADEASGFFKKLSRQDYMSGLDQLMSEVYDGRVPPGAKMSLKELRGKSAMTSFHMSLHSTPEGFWENANREMYLSGFLARANWTFGPPRERNLDYLTLTQEMNAPDDYDTLHPSIAALAVDLTTVSYAIGPRAKPILASEEALQRMTQALREMMSQTWRHDPSPDMEKATTRLGYETMRKCAALNAMWRGSLIIEYVDALVAIDACQSWFDNLFVVLDKISDSEFSRECTTISTYIHSRESVSRAHIFERFRGLIQRSPIELDQKLEFLRESGEIAQRTVDGRVEYFGVK